MIWSLTLTVRNRQKKLKTVRKVFGVKILLWCYGLTQPTMFEIIDRDAVPGSDPLTLLSALPIKQLPAGKAIRIPNDPFLSDAETRRLHAAIRARASRAQSSTGNRYRVTKSDDAIYVVRVA